MTTHQGNADDSHPKYLIKTVLINGQNVTLYSTNGQTWLSSPDQLPEVMERLENARVLLNDPKGEGATMPPKPTAARYRMKGPKPRPILQPDGSLKYPDPVPISASETEVRVGATGVEVIKIPEPEVTRVGLKVGVKSAHEKPSDASAKLSRTPAKKIETGASNKATSAKKSAAKPAQEAKTTRAASIIKPPNKKGSVGKKSTKSRTKVANNQKTPTKKKAGSKTLSKKRNK